MEVPFSPVRVMWFSPSGVMAVTRPKFSGMGAMAWMSFRVTGVSFEKWRVVGMERWSRRFLREVSTLSQKWEQTSSRPMRAVWRECHGWALRPPFESQNRVAGKSMGFFKENQT